MKRRRWTTTEDERLEEMLDLGLSYPRIARALKRERSAVESRRLRLGLPAPTQEHRSIGDIAALLGVDRDTVLRRVHEGRLRVHEVGSGHRPVIHWEDLCAFLEDEDDWHLINPALISDSALREWAIEMRHGLTFLTLGEAARELAVAPSTLNSWIRAGRVRAVRIGEGKWRVRSDWLETAKAAVEPPRGTQSHRSYTDEEDAYLREHRPTTYLIDLARMLGREKSSVAQRCRHLGLSGPTIPLGERLRHRAASWPLPDGQAFVREWAPHQTPRHLAAALEVEEARLSAWMERQRVPRNAPLARDWEDDEEAGREPAA